MTILPHQMCRLFIFIVFYPVICVVYFILKKYPVKCVVCFSRKKSFFPVMIILPRQMCRLFLKKSRFTPLIQLYPVKCVVYSFKNRNLPTLKNFTLSNVSFVFFLLNTVVLTKFHFCLQNRGRF